MISWQTRYGGPKLHAFAEAEADGEEPSQVDLVPRLEHAHVHRLPQAVRAARRAQILETRPAAFPEDPGVARRDERQVQPEIDALPAAEDELGLVDLHFRLAVDRDEQLLSGGALVRLSRRFRVSGYPRRRGGGVGGKRSLDHHPRFEAGAFGEAADEVAV